MLDPNALLSPEEQAEHESKMSAFNRLMSFSVVKPVKKPSSADKGASTSLVKSDAPKPLGW